MKGALFACFLLVGCATERAAVKPARPAPGPGPASRPKPAPRQAPPSSACVFDEKTTMAQSGRCPNEPSGVVCTWSFGLLPARGLPAYAELVADYTRGISTRLSIPVGSHEQGVTVEVNGDAVTLRGHVNGQAEDGYLFARAPRRLGEAVVATSLARLRWFEGKKGSLVVGPHRVTAFTSQQKLRAAVPCAALTLEGRWQGEAEAAIKALLGITRAHKEVLLHRKRSIPLYSAGKQKRVGAIYIDKAVPDKVQVIRENMDRSLVYIEFYSYVLHGWIPNDAIDKIAAEDEGLGGLIGTGRGSHTWLGGACDSPKDLYVKHGHKHHKVGTLGKGRRFFVDGGAGKWTRVSLERIKWFKMAKGYFLYLRADATDDCTLRPPRP